MLLFNKIIYIDLDLTLNTSRIKCANFKSRIEQVFPVSVYTALLPCLLGLSTHKPKVFFSYMAFSICYITASTKKTHYKEMRGTFEHLQGLICAELNFTPNSIRVRALRESLSSSTLFGDKFLSGLPGIF